MPTKTASKKTVEKPKRKRTVKKKESLDTVLYAKLRKMNKPLLILVILSIVSIVILCIIWALSVKIDELEQTQSVIHEQVTSLSR